MVGHLSGDDAQAFIDVIDEVSPHILLPPGNGLVDPQPNSRALSFRHWIAFHNRYARRVCAFYTGSVAAKPDSLNHFQFRFVTT